MAGYDIGLLEDTEICKLLQVAKSMIAADFSVNTEIREALRKKILYVAAGWAGKAGEETCPFCGAMIKTLQGKCPLCRH